MSCKSLLFSALTILSLTTQTALAQNYDREARNTLNSLVDQAESELRAAGNKPEDTKLMLHLADVAILKRFLANPDKLDSMKNDISSIVREVSIEYRARAKTLSQGRSVADQAISIRRALLNSDFQRALGAYSQYRKQQDATTKAPEATKTTMEQILIPPTPTISAAVAPEFTEPTLIPQTTP